MAWLTFKGVTEYRMFSHYGAGEHGAGSKIGFNSGGGGEGGGKHILLPSGYSWKPPPRGLCRTW